MYKLSAALSGLTALTLLFSAPASANVGAGIAHTPSIAAGSQVTKVWHHHHGFRYGLYFGAPYYSYPRYRYYDDYYYRPRYYSYNSYAPYGHHRRHWCGRHDRWEY